jgi:glycosyltransferase involved in cell wall biosynthesis
MNGLSVIVITLNEENNIKECLELLTWTDEIIVIDSNSKDKTVELAKKFTDRIYLVDERSFAFKRNLGIEKATKDWILWIDADERVTDGLKEEIRNAIKNNSGKVDAYLINRKSFFINKFIKHCGWYPDYSIRLFKKSTGLKFNTARVHEELSYKGRTAKLKAKLLHFTDLTFEQYLKKLNSYTTSSSLDLFDLGKKAGLIDIIFRPAFAFLKMYFLKLGFLDGFIGLVLCSLSSIHVLMKYSKLYFLKIN